MEVYNLEKEEGKKVNKMTIFCVEQVVTHSNIFTYYEKNVAKYVMFFYYYNNVDQRWYE